MGYIVFGLMRTDICTKFSLYLNCVVMKYWAVMRLL